MAAFDENEGIDALAEFGLNDEEIAGIQPLAGSTSNAPAKNAKIGELVNAWRTEVGCPEILPYKEELVNTFRRTLQKQERELDKKLDELDEGGDDRLQEMAEHDIYMMDMERVKYSLARYLRARILKIEKMSHYIHNSEEHQDRLSDNEREFLHEISRINNNYIEDQIEKKVRGDKGSGTKKYLKSIQDDLIANAEPDLDTFVFALPDDDIDIIDSLDKPATLNAASAVVIDYNSIKEKVYNGEVFLL